MARHTLGLALLAGALAMALCPAASALNSLPPSWLSDTETNSYYWTSWGDNVGQASFVVGPDVTQGGGSAIATVNIAEPGAGLVTGIPIGTRDTYLDLGPGGTVRLDMTSDVRGVYVYLAVVYDLDFTAAPVVSIQNATLLNSAVTLVEDTSLDPQFPSGWMLGEYLWRVDPPSVGVVQGGNNVIVANPFMFSIDIEADDDFGSIIEELSAHTHFVPEPGSMLALGTGLAALAGLIRRRKA